MFRPTIKNVGVTLQGPHCAEGTFGESTLRGINPDASRHLDGGSEYCCFSDSSMRLISDARRLSLQGSVFVC